MKVLCIRDDWRVWYDGIILPYTGAAPKIGDVDEVMRLVYLENVKTGQIIPSYFLKRYGDAVNFEADFFVEVDEAEEVETFEEAVNI